MNRLALPLFSLFVLADAAVLALVFVLGLAAAKPSHTPVVSVIAFFAVPAALLAALVGLFLKGPGPASRWIATVLAGLPAVLIVGGALLSAGLAVSLGESLERDRLAPQVQRQIESAIASGDTATLARIVADPQAPVDKEAALVAAIRGSRTAGVEPVRVMLDAGARANDRGNSLPTWFAALEAQVDPAVLPLLLERGADLRRVDSAGNGPLYWAVFHRRWDAVLLLLERGADPAARLPDDQGLRQRVEAELRRTPGDAALQSLQRRLKETTAAR